MINCQMFDNIVIRNLQLSDYDSFLRLINDFRETTFTKDQFEETLNTTRKSSDIIVFEYNGELIGTGTLIYEHKFIFNICCLGHIEDVCIKSEFRGRGLGKLIVKHLVTLAQNKKCYKVVLDCSDGNRGFYEKCAFEKRGNQMSMLVD